MRPRALWRLARPLNAAMSGAAVLLAAYVATGPGLPWRDALLGAGAAVLIAIAGNAANDARDHAIDRRAHPDRPIPRGEARVGEAWAVAALFAGAGFACAALAGPRALAVAGAAVLLLALYEWRLKAAGLPGNLVVALLTGAPFLLGGLIADAARPGSLFPGLLLFAAIAAIANLGRELAKDLEDAEADEGRATLPRRGHASLARGLAAGAFILAVLLSPFPYILSANDISGTYLAVVSLADVGFMWAALKLREPARASRGAKGAMLVAMVAFFVGRLSLDVIGW